MSVETVHIMLFEKANFPAVELLIRRLLNHPDLEPLFVKGFDYKELTGEIIPLQPVPGIPWDDLAGYGSAGLPPRGVPMRTGAAGPRDESDEGDIAGALFDAVMARPGMAELFKRYLSERAALEEYCRTRRPRIAVLPEDTDYIRGRMACKVLHRFECRIVVLSPNYYNLSARYPLCGERLGDFYVCATTLLAGRLVDAGVPAGRVDVRGFAAEAPAPGRSPAACDSVLYALQNLPGEDRVLVEMSEIVADGFPGLELLVKAHPQSEPTPAVAAAVASRPVMRLLPPGAGMDAALRSARAVIAQTSTVLYHAIAAGIPVLIPNFEGLPLAVDLPGPVAAQSVVETRGQAVALAQRIVDGRYQFFPTGWLQGQGDPNDLVIRVLESLPA